MPQDRDRGFKITLIVFFLWMSCVRTAETDSECYPSVFSADLFYLGMGDRGAGCFEPVERSTRYGFESKTTTPNSLRRLSLFYY
jgi:hypothetical protein